MRKEVTTLDQYLQAYGSILARQAEESLCPLHVPGRDKPRKLKLLRKPFDAQAHVIEAGAKALARQKTAWIVAEMGTGKTIIGQSIAHAHAASKPYRTLVFCPGQLVLKWGREIISTIPGAKVVQLKTWRDVVALDPADQAECPTWYVIARDRAKLGACWTPVCRNHGRQSGIQCPDCYRSLCNADGDLLGPESLKKRRSYCEHVLTPNGVEEGCRAALWQYTRKIDRYEPATYIKRRLRGFFDYLILDEVHEEKGADTAQANAAGSLAAAAKKVILLTGTLIGGMAEHIRPLLFRMAPRTLVEEGFGWSDVMPFSERYGRIETTVIEKERDADDNRQSRGGKRTIKNIKPGIVPTLFGRHLLDKAIFLSLDEVAVDLPKFEETCVAVDMDAETKSAYAEIEEDLRDALTEMLRKKDRRLLGTMLQTLLAYPDMPYGWGDVGYKDNDGNFVPVTHPKNLKADKIRPKERKLISLVKAEKKAGRQVWVFVQFTDKHNVQARLERILKDAGLKVGSLRSDVELAKREAWIAKHAPGLDVVVSHPRLVETGLDLFDKGGAHNFATLVFYETGYNLFTLRQASRRAWRIGQKKKCKVIYLYYAETMQGTAMNLMGKKMAAAQALDGKFSEEGLAAMSDDGSVEMALARSLVDKIDGGGRIWAKVGRKRVSGGSSRAAARAPRKARGSKRAR